MDTNETLRAHISALVDGELPQADVELALAALQETDGKQTWDQYHLIRDALRATPVPDLSPGFAERLAVRLAQSQSQAQVPSGSEGMDDGGTGDSGSATGVTAPGSLTASLANPGAA